MKLLLLEGELIVTQLFVMADEKAVNLFDYIKRKHGRKPISWYKQLLLFSHEQRPAGLDNNEYTWTEDVSVEEVKILIGIWIAKKLFCSRR